MLLKNKVEEIKTLIKTGSVLTTLEERYCYSTDASNVIKNTKVPDIVVFVQTIEEVQNIVQYANKHKIPIISRGAGTNMVGACACQAGGIILNFSKMNKILEINTTNMTAVVQPGVILGDLKSAVDELGLFYPPDPSNYRVSTVGGSIAQSSAGAMAYKYGTTKDYILSLKVVTADGSLISLGADTIKDSVGYHLSQLMVGSEGTLGIVVEATLKLIPKPEACSLVVGYFMDIENAINAVTSINKEQIFPAAIDFMDKNSMKTVEDYLSCGLLIENNCMLMVHLDGLESGMAAQKAIVENVFNKFGASAIYSTEGSDMEKFWQARRASFAAAARLAPDIVTDDIIVPRDKIVNLIKSCNEIASKYNLKMCLVGHIGDGNLHPQLALNLEDEDEFRTYQKAKSEMYSIVKALGGTISAEHGIGLEKISYLEDIIDEKVLSYMKMVKRIFDPNNILNPGKIFKL